MDIEEQLKEFLFELETNVDDTYIDTDRKMLYLREITDESILKIIKEFNFKESLQEFKEKYCDLLHDLTTVSKFYICQSGADKFGKGVLFLSKLGYEEIRKYKEVI